MNARFKREGDKGTIFVSSLFVAGKLYAITHVRSDRWYKLGRTLLYGRLEDEAPADDPEAPALQPLGAGGLLRLPVLRRRDRMPLGLEAVPRRPFGERHTHSVRHSLKTQQPCNTSSSRLCHRGGDPIAAPPDSPG